MARKLVMLAVVAGLMLAALIQPAGAAHFTGVVVTGCTTTLIDFPNQGFGKNNDDCDNNPRLSPTGGAVDFALGVIHTGSGDWVGGGPGATKVSFSYNESCTGAPPNVFPPNGTASGNFVVGGSIGRLIAGFTWSRAGLTAIIGFASSIAGHNLEDGTVIPAGLFGIDTNNNLADGVEIPATNVTAAAIGLLQPRGGAGSNGLPYNNCPDQTGDQFETVTAYAAGVLGSAS